MNDGSAMKKTIQVMKYPIRLLLHQARIKKLKSLTGTVILMLHDIGDEPRNEYAIHPDILEKHILLLLHAGFTFIRLSEIVEEMKTGALKDAKRIAFTFDDGYRGLHTHGLPLFRQYGIYPALYLTTEFLNSSSWFSYAKGVPSIISESEAPLCDGFRRDFLTDGQVNELIEYGAEIGSHSVYHTHLTEIPEDLLEMELMQSKERLENRYHLAINDFAYPFGDYNKTVRDRAGTHYRSCVSVHPDKVTPQSSLLELPRVNMDLTEMDFVHSLYIVMKKR